MYSYSKLLKQYSLFAIASQTLVLSAFYSHPLTPSHPESIYLFQLFRVKDQGAASHHLFSKRVLNNYYLAGWQKTPISCPQDAVHWAAQKH